ncbi:MAG: glycosyltransferase [Paludibacteraceae bacterium]|nr:glycosyltransferase [Paludibacteraceae bacterium]
MFGIFNDNFPPILDGVALTAQNYAYWLHEKGHDVSVITPYAPKSEKAIKAAPYPIHRFPSIPIPFRAPYRYGLPYLSPAFMHRYHQLQFELVHAHCPFVTGNLAYATAQRQHIPMVATFHSKYRQDFEHNVPNKRVVDWMVRTIIERFERADEVWIPQAAVEPTIREYGFKGHVEVVENGNDFYTPVEQIEAMRQEMREELGLLPDETMLLFVGQHIWEKNIGFILDALALIKERPFHLFMVGTGYAVRDIRHKIAQLGLQDRVTMLGNIHDRERLKRIDAAADLFLFPSLYDNAPLVVREAAAMHTPALMLQESTAAEVIKKDVNGFLTPNDLQQYADRIAYLMEHREMLKKVGNKAANTIARSWENVIEEVILRYRDIEQSYKIKHGIIIP